MVGGWNLACRFSKGPFAFQTSYSEHHSSRDPSTFRIFYPEPKMSKTFGNSGCSMNSTELQNLFSSHRPSCCHSITQLDSQIMSNIQENSLQQYTLEIDPKMMSSILNIIFASTSTCHQISRLHQSAFGLPNLQTIRSCWSSKITSSLDVSRSRKRPVVTCTCHTNFRVD